MSGSLASWSVIFRNYRQLDKMLLLLLLLASVYVIYKYVTANNNYWKDRGVPYEPPTFLFGSLKDNIMMRKHFGQIMTDIYRKHEDVSYVGIFKLMQPQLLLRDPEVIKDVLIKDFQSFQDNDIQLAVNESVISKHPFVLSGEEWKTVRSQFLQCFTAAKMKTLVSSMETVSDRFLTYIEEMSKEQGALEAKEICTRYTVENVINTSFGMEANCFQPGVSTFMEMSYKIFYPNVMQHLRVMCVLFLPQLSKYLDMRLVPNEVEKYFVNLITDLVKYRTENDVHRKDFLDILLEIKEKLGEECGMENLLSHSMTLFADGTETSGNSMSFALYEIAANPDVQTKLREEVKAIKKKYDGKLTYEAIQDMTYMDCVINESLRMYPPALALFKRCTQDYTLSSPYEDQPQKTVHIKAGTPLIIPVQALHFDEKLYPDPDTFKPERFSEENKAHLTKCTYLPFGDGPRICPGQRFAFLQMKVGLAEIVSNFEIRVSQKTVRPLEINPKYFMLLIKGGLWVDFHKIS